MLWKIRDGIFVMSFVLCMLIAILWLDGFELDNDGVTQCSLGDHPTNWLDTSLHPYAQNSDSLTIFDW